MPTLKVQGTDRVLGQISADQLQFLVDQLEEEDSRDKDYYINRDTLAMLEARGCDAELLTLLKDAMGDKDELDIEWE